jgi:hypothetical protein
VSIAWENKNRRDVDWAATAVFTDSSGAFKSLNGAKTRRKAD